MAVRPEWRMSNNERTAVKEFDALVRHVEQSRFLGGNGVNEYVLARRRPGQRGKGLERYLCPWHPRPGNGLAALDYLAIRAEKHELHRARFVVLLPQVPRH